MTGDLVAVILAGIFVVVAAIVGSVVYLYYFRLWFRTHIAQCSLGLFTIIGMTFRNVNPQVMVNSYIDLHKAGIPATIDSLEAHAHAGGHVRKVVQALVAASRNGRPVTLEEACVIDLAGRDVMEEIGTVVDYASTANE